MTRNQRRRAARRTDAAIGDKPARTVEALRERLIASGKIKPETKNSDRGNGRN